MLMFYRPVRLHSGQAIFHDWTSLFYHLSEFFEAQIKAHFLETFDLAHLDHSFFKSVALDRELFIWY